MAKITLANILSGFNLSKINANFAAIQDVLNNKVLFRDNPVGEPNTLQQDLDLNGKNLLNVGTLQVSNSFNINGLDLATQVQNAANSATAAQTSANASATSANNSATSLDSFKKQYQGRSASAPTTRYDGTALQVGDLYFNTTLNAMQVYGSSGWIAAGSSVNGTARRQTFTYTSGTPQFTITGGYDSGFVDVYLNGYKLVRTTDFDDTSGTAITVNGSLISGDIVDIVAYGTFTIANVYLKGEIDSKVGTLSSIGWRNRLINGDMRIDQRNSGASVATTSGSPATIFPVDRFKIYSEATSGTVTGQRMSGDGPVGFSNYLRVQVTATGTIAPNGPLYLTQVIEGYNVSDLAFGTASASSVTVSFWYRSSVSGLHSGALKSGDVLRTYPFSFTVNSANTWEYKTVVIPGDVTGTWATDNTAGMYLVFNIASGSSKTGTAGSWTTSQVWGVTGAAYLLGTLNATVDVTGIQLEAGAVATPYERVSYGEMLRRCQRYYETFTFTIGRAYNATQVDWGIKYLVTKRSSVNYSVIKPAHTVGIPGGAAQTSSGSTVSSGISTTSGGFINITGYTGLTAGTIMVPYDSSDVCAAACEL